MGFGYKVQHTGIQMSIANAQVTLDRTNFEYDEQQHEPVVQLVQVGDAELVAYQDYVAYITPATDAGDYNVIVSGMGDYSGAKNVPWHIDKAQGTISVEPQSVELTGVIGTSTTVTLTYKGDGEITLGESDYVILSREENTVTVTSKAAGSGSVTITLEDGRNYKGATVELSVSVSSLSEADPVFENNTWETIAAYCAAGEVPETWQIGDTKSGTWLGEEQELQIIGKNHDDLDETDEKYSDPTYNSGSKKAALTLLPVNQHSTAYRMNSTNTNATSWKDSEMRTETIPTLDALTDPEIRAVMRTVTKCTGQSYNDSTIVKTADKVFLLSHIEIFESVGSSQPGEGTQYEYFAAGNSKVKTRGGSADYWWTRSPSTGSSLGFRLVSSSGATSGSNTSSTWGVVAGFCI